MTDRIERLERHRGVMATCLRHAMCYAQLGHDIRETAAVHEHLKDFLVEFISSVVYGVLGFDQARVNSTALRSTTWQSPDSGSFIPPRCSEAWQSPFRRHLVHFLCPKDLWRYNTPFRFDVLRQTALDSAET